MNRTLQQKLSSLEALIALQKDSIAAAGHGVNYMHGMANGMILAHSIFDGTSPNFVRRPKKAYNCNIRHKCAKPRRNIL